MMFDDYSTQRQIKVIFSTLMHVFPSSRTIRKFRTNPRDLMKYNYLTVEERFNMLDDIIEREKSAGRMS